MMIGDSVIKKFRKGNREASEKIETVRKYTQQQKSIKGMTQWDNHFLVQSDLNEGKLAKITMETKIKCIFEIIMKIWEPGWE